MFYVPEEIGVTVRKSEDFSEWYTQVVLRAGLADYAPVQGCIVFREYGYALWERIQEFVDGRIKARGVRNVYFPVFIPESLLRKEAEHFKGFVPECAWVTVGGDSELGERLAVRPTSETIMYVMLSKWVKSWRDLPIRMNQWCNIVRWEKATKPFLRTTEFLWQEGHTAHATKEEADREVKEILSLYRELVEGELAIPVLVGLKSEGEKFAGALYTTTLEALMPDGRALQLGTSHNLGQNFSIPFEIRFLGEDGGMHFVWQTSWGVTTRLIGAVVMAHGDDKGLILPPRIAPTQVVIVPIFYSEEQRAKIVEKARGIYERLSGEGVRACLDDRTEYTPGWKFNEWELKGVPLRIEVGPRDFERGEVTMVRRGSSEKSLVRDDEVVSKAGELLESIQRSLYEKAKRFLDENIRVAEGYEQFKELLGRGGFVKACWCGSGECEDAVKAETGATIRVIPFEGEQTFSPCIYCRKEARDLVYFARAY